MKVYHMGSKFSDLDDIQVIFVVPDDTKGINNIKEWYAQITVRKKQKTVDVLLAQNWFVRQFSKTEYEP